MKVRSEKRREGWCLELESRMIGLSIIGGILKLSFLLLPLLLV